MKVAGKPVQPGTLSATLSVQKERISIGRKKDDQW